MPVVGKSGDSKQDFPFSGTMMSIFCRHNGVKFVLQQSNAESTSLDRPTARSFEDSGLSDKRKSAGGEYQSLVYPPRIDPRLPDSTNSKPRNSFFEAQSMVTHPSDPEAQEL
jgi:hypothetical protein